MTSPFSTSDFSAPLWGAGGPVRSGQTVSPRSPSGAWAFPGNDEAGEVRKETGVPERPLATLPPSHAANNRGEARMIHWFLTGAAPKRWSVR